MKKFKKMSLANIEGKLSRNEMKTVMAEGVGDFLKDYVYGAALDWVVDAMYKDYQSRSGGPYSASGRLASMGPY